MSEPTDKFREVQDVTREELEREHKHVRRVPVLPVNWKDGATGQTQAQSSAVIQPTGRDVETFSSVHQNVCGQCKFFDLEAGRREIIRQRFAERLVHDHEWKLRHLGADLQTIGLCGMSGGETATSFTSKSCDQFRPRAR